MESYDVKSSYMADGIGVTEAERFNKLDAITAAGMRERLVSKAAFNPKGTTEIEIFRNGVLVKSITITANTF